MLVTRVSSEVPAKASARLCFAVATALSFKELLWSDLQNKEFLREYQRGGKM